MKLKRVLFVACGTVVAACASAQVNYLGEITVYSAGYVNGEGVFAWSLTPGGTPDFVTYCMSTSNLFNAGSVQIFKEYSVGASTSVTDASLSALKATNSMGGLTNTSFMAAVNQSLSDGPAMIDLTPGNQDDALNTGYTNANAFIHTLEGEGDNAPSDPNYEPYTGSGFQYIYWQQVGPNANNGTGGQPQGLVEPKSFHVPHTPGPAAALSMAAGLIGARVRRRRA